MTFYVLQKNVFIHPPPPLQKHKMTTTHSVKTLIVIVCDPFAFRMWSVEELRMLLGLDENEGETTESDVEEEDGEDVEGELELEMWKIVIIFFFGHIVVTFAHFCDLIIFSLLVQS